MFLNYISIPTVKIMFLNLHESQVLKFKIKIKCKAWFHASHKIFERIDLCTFESRENLKVLKFFEIF